MRTAFSVFTTIVLAVGSIAPAYGTSDDVSQSPAEAARKSMIRRLQPLVLVDAAGKTVGLYSPTSSSVILNVQNALIVADVSNQLDVNVPFASLGEQSGSRFKWAIRGETWFLSTDCSGQPIPLANTGLRPVAYTQDRATGTLTAYIGGAGRSTAKRANSVRQAALGGGPGGGQCQRQSPFGGAIQGFDVEHVVNISQRYPEALTVE